MTMKNGDPKKLVDEMWYEYLGTPVVARQYDDGGIKWSIWRWDGTEAPFSNIPALNTEGSVITKDEAVALHSEEARRIKAYKDAASKPR